MGDRPIAEIRKSEIAISGRAVISLKTISDMFTVVRGTWSDGVDDGVIRPTVLDRISNVERDAWEDHANPSSLSDMEKVRKVKTRRPPDINMVMVVCWSGLCVSEPIALVCEDVDMENGTILVRRARGVTEYKVLKKGSRIRKVRLIEPQKILVTSAGGTHHDAFSLFTDVHQRNNVAVERNGFGSCSAMATVAFPGICIACLGGSQSTEARGVEHRGPNQYRGYLRRSLAVELRANRMATYQLGHLDTTRNTIDAGFRTTGADMEGVGDASWVPD